MVPVALVLVAGLVLSPAGTTEPPRPAAPELPPLVEVHRTHFDEPFAQQQSFRPQLAVSPSAPVAYALSRSYLFVVDSSEAKVLEVLDLDDLFHDPYDNWGLVLSIEGGTERLVLWNWDSDALWVFSLADPAHPVLERSVRGVQDPRFVGVLPGRAAALVVGETAILVNLVTGERFVFPPPAGHLMGFWGGAVGGNPERPVVVLGSFVSSYPQWRTFLSAFSAEDPASPVLLWDVELTSQQAGLLVDRSGQVVVVGSYAQGGLRGFDVRDLSNGAVLSSFETPARGNRVVLAEGGGERVLAVADDAGVDLVDLAEPSSPEVRGRVEARLSGASDRSLSPSSTEPLLFVGATGDGEVLSVDIRSASIVGRWPAGDPAPVALALGEGAGGRRDAVVLSQRVLGERVLVRGGLSELDFVDFSIAASPQLRGRFARVLPDEVDGFVTVGGAYGVAADVGTNTLVLFRLVDGEVLDVTGFFSRPDPWGNWYSHYEGVLRAAGSTVLAVLNDRYEVFDVFRQRLVSRAQDRFQGSQFVTDGAVRRDGTAVVLICGELRTHLPDGRTGRLALPFSCGRDLSLSPGGDLALVGFPSYDWDESNAAVVDLSDPAEPKVLWQGLPGYASGIFLEDGERLFVTTNYYGSSFDSALLDARTGAPLGEPAEGVEKYAYHDVAATYGRGEDARVVVWKWTFRGWKTVLFDAGTGTPRVLAILPEFFAIPDYLARDGGGWYEFQGNPWTGPSTILVSDASGAQTEGFRADRFVWWHASRSLRRGFFAALEEEVGYEAPDIVTWRDTALNRPPIARAGGDRTVECDDRDATPAVLDGSGSSDPDSTPGTSDDIASYAWTVDSAAAGAGPTVSVSLGYGEHTAALRVEDVLGLVGTDEAKVLVQDTLAPAVTLALEPLVSGGVWGGLWAPHATVLDRCDGALAPAERLVLAEGAAGAPVEFRRSASRLIEVRSRKTGMRVVLLGPHEAEARALWQVVVVREGFELPDGEGVGMTLAPAGHGSDADLVARYELGQDGRLVRATVLGAGGDLVVEASGSDAAGHVGVGRASLRETREALCDALPSGLVCLGF